MTAPVFFAEAFAACPLVAILRGVLPTEVEDIGKALVDAGFTLIEVPLNSPDPLLSITRLAEKFHRSAVIGAGTVLKTAQIDAVAAAGGRMIVSPNADTDVITRSIECGCASLPGYFTPSEGFAAIAAGAHALKLFPAEGATPALFKAQGAVLPPDVPRLVVGGITPEAMGLWRDAGAAGFGLGSALFKPGMTASTVSANARRFVAAWRG